MSREKIKAIIKKHQTGCSEDEAPKETVRRPHFPVKPGHRHYGSSGVTIGSGIDLGGKDAKEIRQLFKDILPQAEIAKIITAAGLKGEAADRWVRDHKHEVKLSEEAFQKSFDRAFEEKQRTMNRIVTSDAFRNKYLVDGEQLMRKMKPEYKIVMLDTLYMGKNTPKTRQKIIPILVKMHKGQATEQDRADLNKQIGNLYTGHKERGESIRKIIGGGFKEQPRDTLKTNRQFKQITNNTNVSKLSDILHKRPSEKVGGVDLSYDLSSITINGLKLGQKFTEMHLEKGEYPYLRDLIVPLKIYYDKSIQYKNISISIDPKDPKNPDGPLYQKIYYPKQMEGTYFAQVMVEADYLMKQLILGADERGRPFKYPKSLKNVGLAFEDQLQYFDTLQERTRQWIVIKKVHFLKNNQNNVEVGQIEMGLQARVQYIGSEGRLADSQSELSSHIKKFCQLFTKHYNLLAQEYQCFRIIKRLAKASIIARLMFQKGCRINQRLINELFKLEMTDKSSKMVSKLANSMVLNSYQLPLIKGGSSNKISLNLTGGCDLTYKEQMATIQSQKYMDVQSKNNYIPFLFQDYTECEQQGCDNMCVNGAGLMYDTKCDQHTKNICQICWKLLIQNEKFVKLNDGRLIHPQCLQCQTCYGNIKGNYIQRATLFYHQECSRSIVVGSCYVCEGDVGMCSDYLTGSRGLIHKKCSENFQCEICRKNQSLQNLINLNEKFYHKPCIKCCICRLQIQGNNYRFGPNGFLHQECISIITCEVCKQSIQGPYQKLNDKTYHPNCLVCYKCKKVLSNQIKCDSFGDFYHTNCI